MRSLFIEDAEIHIKLLQISFIKIFPGIQMDIAKTISEAELMIKSHNYDVIIVDLSIPSVHDEDGEDIVRKYRAEGGRAIVIAHTAKDIRTMQTPEHFDLILNKPVSSWKNVMAKFEFTT